MVRGVGRWGEAEGSAARLAREQRVLCAACLRALWTALRCATLAALCGSGCVYRSGVQGAGWGASTHPPYVGNEATKGTCQLALHA